jgi:thioredoxin 1
MGRGRPFAVVTTLEFSFASLVVLVPLMRLLPAGQESITSRSRVETKVPNAVPEQEDQNGTLPLIVTDANFRAEVEEFEGLVLLDFWAEWCGPCLEIAPILDDIAREYEGNVKIGKIDVTTSEDNPALAQKFGVDVLPLFVLLHGGDEIERYEGLDPDLEPAEFLRKWLGRHVGSPELCCDEEK